MIYLVRPPAYKDNTFSLTRRGEGGGGGVRRANGVENIITGPNDMLRLYSSVVCKVDIVAV